MPADSATSEARNWPVLLAAFVATGLTHGLASSIGVFYVEWHLDYPESSALVGWLSSSLLAMMLCSAPIVGVLTKRFGARPVVVAGGLLSFCGLLLASLVDEFVVLFITIPFMSGTGFGMANTGFAIQISQCFHRNYAMANGIMTAGSSVGMVSLPNLFRLLIDSYGWRRALLVFSAVHAHVLVCAAFIRSPRSRPTGKRSQPLAEESASAEAPRGSSSEGGTHRQQRVTYIRVPSGKATKSDGCSRSIPSENVESVNGVRVEGRVEIKERIAGPCAEEEVQEGSEFGNEGRMSSSGRSCLGGFLDDLGLSLLWTNRVFCCFIPVTFFLASVYGITLSYLVARAKSVGVPQAEATFLISVIGFSTIVTRLSHGRVLDAGLIQPAHLFCLLVGLSSVAGPVIAAFETHYAFVVSAVLIGLSTGGFIPMIAFLIRKMVGKEMFPGGYGIGRVVIALGNMFSAFSAGYLFDVTGSYSAGFYCMGVLAGVAVAIVLVFHLVWTRLVPDDRWPQLQPCTDK